MNLAGVTYSPTIQINKSDPTRTTVLRNVFAQQMRNRFNAVARGVRFAVDDLDVFELRDTFLTQQVTPPGFRAFDFPRSSDKIEAFMRWLRQQVDNEILELSTFNQIGSSIEGAWTNVYIADSYKRGIIRARYELRKAGFDVPMLEQTGGVDVSFSTPFHADRVGLLYTRTFEGLRGITTAMDTQISRVLAQGMIDGDGPAVLARKLVAVINGTGAGELGITDTLGRYIPARRRAEMLARTEIISAHHQAMIQEYENWAVEGFVVKAEWSTAGDDRVCAVCEGFEGQVFTLNEIRSLIPAHPLCRCIALPFKQSITSKKGLGLLV